MEDALKKKKLNSSLMGQIMAGEKKIKKKRKTEYKVDIWQKDPTAEELKEMSDLTANLERDGIRVDQETIRRGIVNENVPKHMTLIG